MLCHKIIATKYVVETVQIVFHLNDQAKVKLFFFFIIIFNLGQTSEMVKQ